MLKKFGFIPPDWSEAQNDNPEDPISNLFLGIIPKVLETCINKWGKNKNTYKTTNKLCRLTNDSPPSLFLNAWDSFKAIAILKTILLQAIISERLSAYEKQKQRTVRSQ